MYQDQRNLSEALEAAMMEAEELRASAAGFSDAEGNKRDPRINFNVCVTHTCEEAMEALDAAKQLEDAIKLRATVQKPWSTVHEDVIQLTEHFLEELADVIYAARRLCFYTLEENKPMDAACKKILDSIHEHYTGFAAPPYSDNLRCAIRMSMYTIRVLRTQNIGYPTRHSFDTEFPKYLDALREVLRYLIYNFVPYLIENGVLEEETWKTKVRDWIIYKIIRKRKADLMEGNVYYDGGY